MNATINMVALRKNGAISPANSKTKPAIKGPGTWAMLDKDSIMPNILP